MQAFTVTEIKPFMAGLLQGNLFQDWELRQAELGLACRITLQGNANRDYAPEHTGDYLRWPEIQPRVRGLIQGGHTPSYMRLTLAYTGDSLPEARRDWVDGLLLNLQYEKNTLTLISALATNTFSMDREPERLWDAFVPDYFAQHSILLKDA